MHSEARFILFLFLFSLLVVPAVPLQAGDPVPDVDVTVEQNPGASIWVDVPRGGSFTEVRLNVLQKIAKNVSPGALPTGWTLSRDGRDLVLRGPALEPPVRLRLTLAGTDRPREVTYEVRRDGTSLVRHENVVPRPVPPRQVRNSLQGVVQIPSQVTPGEPVAFRPLAKADLPPDGRFTLSGVVAEPFTEAEWSSIPHALVNALRSRAKPTREPIEVAGSPGGCDELAAMAAAVAASKSGGDPQGKPDKAWAVAELSNVLKTKHDTAKGAIRNLKLFAAAPAGTGESQGIAIKEEGVQIAIKEEGIEYWRAAPSGTPAGSGSSVRWGPARGDLPLDAPATRLVALRGEPTANGCRFEPREPGWAETARAVVNKTRSNIKGMAAPAPTATATNTLSGTVYVAELPADLVPGSLLSLQYLDLYGDLWLDVPAVPDTSVLPPPDRAEAASPCIRSATRHAQLGDLVCVCGTFPTPSAWSGLLVGDRPAGTPASASSTTVWLTLPEGTPLGRTTVSGRSDLGFARDCTAALDVVLIRGEIDSQRLLRGETTPMRLRVEGTTDPLPVRIRNLTPSIIQIEGGLEQVTESSGGPENQITRPVRGLTRGDFNVEWSLARSSCPCAEGAPAPPRP